MSLPYEHIINRAIDDFSRKELPNLQDFNHLKALSQVQHGLIVYEAQARNMSFEELINEAHDSVRLARHMTEIGEPRPNQYCDCHAIISGKDPRAVPMRGIMAWLKVRIDFPVNGVWLPKNTDAKSKMPHYLNNAIPHSRIHRNGYYQWMATLIDQSRIKDDKSLAQTLKEIRFKLETSTFPSYVMLRADQLR